MVHPLPFSPRRELENGQSEGRLMAQKVTKYGVFISSRGDVDEERLAVRNVIDRWNLEHSATKKIVLEALMWQTHVQPTMDAKVQEAINQGLLKRADLLIGILWSRMAPPTNKFESGTEEEIRLFKGKEHVYFSEKAATLPRGHDRADFCEQLNRVEAFRKELESTGFVRTFSSLDDLEQQVSRGLTQWVDEQGAQSDPI